MKSIDPYKKTPNRIGELIYLSKKTLKQISEETGISYSTLGNYNQGTRTPKKENAKILADYFGVSIPYLLGFETKIPTRNAIAVSHAIINPIIPSDFAYEAKENLEIRLDNYRKTEIIRPSRESLITAKLFFLPNMIKHNTGKSKELMQALNNQENVLEFIPQKELFNKATANMTIIDMMNTKEIRNEHKIFFKNIVKSLDQIELTIDEL